jgi:hypothetical protein
LNLIKQIIKLRKLIFNLINLILKLKKLRLNLIKFIKKSWINIRFKILKNLIEYLKHIFKNKRLRWILK